MLDLAANRRRRRMSAFAGAGMAWDSRPVRIVGLIGLALANVFIAYEFSRGRRAALGLDLVPILVLAAALVIRRPAVLVFGALALTMFGSTLNTQLPVGGSVEIFPADLFVAASAGLWLVQRAGRHDRRQLRASILGLPLFFLFLAIFIGVVRGHERWGTSLFAQPIRIVAYAAIAVAVADLTPRTAYRGLVAIFYLGAGWQACLAVFHLATGTSQTSSPVSTGGTRPLALSTAMLLAASLVLALLNLDRDQGARRRTVHLAVAAAATLGIAVSLGRTTFAAVAVLAPLLALALPRMRRAVLSLLPLFLPVVALVVVLLIHFSPNLGPSLQARLTGKLGNDSALVTRKHKIDATLHGYQKTPWLGFGFGRPVTYTSVDRSRQTFSGDPENSYVYLLAGGGLLALLAWGGLSLAFVSDAARRFRRAVGTERRLVLWSTATWFVFSVNAVTGPILTADPSLLLTLWIVMLLPALIGVEERAALPHRESDWGAARRAVTSGAKASTI
jgi:hypothetical protein